MPRKAGINGPKKKRTLKVPTGYQIAGHGHGFVSVTTVVNAERNVDNLVHHVAGKCHAGKGSSLTRTAATASSAKRKSREACKERGANYDSVCIANSANTLKKAANEFATFSEELKEDDSLTAVAYGRKIGTILKQCVPESELKEVITQVLEEVELEDWIPAIGGSIAAQFGGLRGPAEPKRCEL
jgi:hypothetical protein